MTPPSAAADPPRLAAGGADTIHWAFDEHQHRLRAITRRVQQRFEHRDWTGIRRDTVERLTLYPRSLSQTFETLREQLGASIADRGLWAEMKSAFAMAVTGRNDFELAETYFNSLTRRVFPHVGVDPAIDYGAGDFPLPYKGWEMADARMYAVRHVDAAVVRKVLEDAGLRAPFRDLDKDARLAAAHIERGIREGLGAGEIEALDVLRPIFFRNKGAYLIGRARRGEAVLPIVLAILNDEAGLWVDAVLPTEDETSLLFSFARWYFHIDVESPRGVIGFLRSILPRKRVSELYLSLGYKHHGKTELYRELIDHIDPRNSGSEELFVTAPGQRGLVMEVFTLPSYDFVLKVIKDAFPSSKPFTREQVMERYRSVLLVDRVGRLAGFHEFEHLTFPRARFSAELLDRLLEVAGKTVALDGEAGDKVIVRHVYVERRVTPLDIYVRESPLEAARPAVLDWGQSLKDMAAADIFPGDVLLKNFGVTRHGRVISYDYDELRALTECHFLPLPTARTEEQEMASEPWFTVQENDIFPEELRTFLGLEGDLRTAFLREHADLFDVDFWHRMQERNRRGEVIDFFPYGEARRLRPGWRRKG